jgi:hypothetical protein
MHHSQDGTSSLGYAVSRQGARKMLYEIGLKSFSAPFDLLLRYYCEGNKNEGRRHHVSLTSQPGLFQHHRHVGPNSAHIDILEHDAGYRTKAYTDSVRWSVMLNAEAIMAGEPRWTSFTMPRKSRRRWRRRRRRRRPRNSCV